MANDFERRRWDVKCLYAIVVGMTGNKIQGLGLSWVGSAIGVLSVGLPRHGKRGSNET